MYFPWACSEIVYSVLYTTCCVQVQGFTQHVYVTFVPTHPSRLASCVFRPFLVLALVNVSCVGELAIGKGLQSWGYKFLPKSFHHWQGSVRKLRLMHPKPQTQVQEAELPFWLKKASKFVLKVLLSAQLIQTLA